MNDFSNWIKFIEKIANHKCDCVIDDCNCFWEYIDEARNLIHEHNIHHKYPLGRCECLKEII